MNDNEIKFLQYVNNSNNALVRKFNLLLNQKVLTQLSRGMLTELFENYRDTLEPKFNVKAVCMQCANSLFNIVKGIAMKYFELQAKWEQEIKDDELSVERIDEIYIQNNLKNEEILLIKNHILDVINNTKNDENITAFETIYNENTLELSTVSNTLEVFTEEKKETFVKPVVHKKTDNTTPLLNKNNKKNNKR
jgi:hypothetical protein